MSTFSPRVAEKALRLVHENRVIIERDVHPFALAMVAGMTRTHTVIADYESVRCSCPAWRPNRACAHQLAAMIVWASEAATVEPRGGWEATSVAGALGVRAHPRAERAQPTTQGDAA